MFQFINIIVFIILLLLTVFFVISEFAIIRVRRSRLEYLIVQEDKRAKAVQKILNDLSSYLSTTQLGVTLTALAMGWIGEPAIGHLIKAGIASFDPPEALLKTGSSIIAFILITYLNVVLGELAPKNYAIQQAEKAALFIARPLILFHHAFYPFIWTLNSSANLISRLFNIDPDKEEQTHSEEELRFLLTESYQGGEINREEFHYVNNIFEFDNRRASEIMVPRTEMVVLDKTDQAHENERVIQEKKFTRYPVTDHDTDHIVGLVNVKDIIHYTSAEKMTLVNFVRPVIKVIETIKIKQLLVRMQKERVHMAILVDEYGGTAGLITVEDILEEIVGEIRDEFDEDEQPFIHQKESGEILVQGSAPISEVNRLLGTDIEEAGLNTIGGWLLMHQPEAKPGTVVSYGLYTFEVKKMSGPRVTLIQAIKQDTT